MYLLFLCFLLYQSDAIEDELEVNLKFYKNQISNYTLLKEIHEAVINYRPIMIKPNENNYAPINYELNDRKTKEAINTQIYSKLKYKYPDMLQKYETHAIQRGIARLRDIPYYMTIELHIRKDTLPPIDIFIKNFTKKARNFFSKLYKQKLSTNIDKEYSVIDTAHTFNVFVYNEEISLLNDMVFKHNLNITTDTMMIILKHFYNEMIENQRADIEYLCIKFEICRPTMRFTDSIGDMAQELLKLSNAKLNHIFLKLLIHIKDHINFFEFILGNSSAIEIYTNLENLIYRDASKIRQTLVDFRSYLAKRHKFSQYSEDDVNSVIRNKALRILLDIIDQSFNVDGDEMLAMHFNVILKSIQDWSEGRKNEIEKILKASVIQALGFMKINLNDVAYNEIKALVDILMNKEDKNSPIYQYLFTHGSLFVRGEDIPLKISLLL